MEEKTMPETTDRAQLEAELNAARRKHKQLEDRLSQKSEIGLAADSTGTYQLEVLLAQKERLEDQIKTLQDTLDRVAEGEYGVCVRCGQPINPERLEILPTTKLCVDCAREVSA